MIKSKRIGLFSPTDSGNYINANKVAELMGVDIHAVTDCWINNHNLKAKKKVIRYKRKMYMIKFTDLLQWLEDNQDKWDSRRIELYDLGQEPQWLKEKRKSDTLLPTCRFHKYSPIEDGQIISMFRRGMKIKDIALAMNRSINSVERRISRLDVWGTGKYIGNKVS